MDIDLNRLMVFRDLAISGNFSETGRRMGLSQPAVSLTISQLESSVGLVLLERHASGAKLTPEGVAFCARAEEVCQAYVGFNNALKLQSRRIDKVVWVGVDSSFYAERLADSLKSDKACKDLKFCCGKVGDDWAKDLE